MDGDGTTLRYVVHRTVCFNQIMDKVRCSGGGGGGDGGESSSSSSSSSSN
jgi:hypothetical protein